MKKFYAACAAVFFAAATVTAQNIKLNDFEDGAADSWASWQGGASVEVVDNPSATEPNTSSKALKLTPETAWGSIAKWMGDGFLTKESAKISVLVYSTDAENEIKIYLENGGAGEEKNETETFKPVAQNTWTRIEFNLAGDVNWAEYKQLAFQPKTAGVIYFDDITVSYPENSGPKLTNDFEDKQLGDTEHAIGWGGMEAVIAEDPLASGNQVLKFTPNNYNSAPVLAFTLPEGDKLSAYSTFTFKAHWAQGDVGYKHIKVFAWSTLPSGAFDDDGSAGTLLGSINREKGASTSWEYTEIDITNTLELEGTVFIGFGINCNGTQDEVTTIWYADDVSLVGTATSLPNAPQTNSGASVFSKAGGLQVAGLQNNSITVYNLTGTKVFEQNAASGDLSIALPGGLYLVKVDQKVSKVLVK
ncbi:carbohydrate binding domain-containing protein [Geofilum rhodophaeum]|uniref:carbohydrate binding domain-containing protein n=1 Tax=Geofilum rhodophaeum TaxID=1965019 RepID=UPI000B51FC4D|nr:carbohydrate binding domain-containing protein [Geofilum rhodophaeum]